MFLSPSFTFGLAVGSLYGLVAHIALRGDLQRLPAYVFTSLVGFGVGQAVGQVMNIGALAMGQVNMLAATLGSMIALVTAAILMAGRHPR